MSLLLDGLASGSVIALMGLGVVVIYRSTGVLTFAQGVLASLGAYVYFQASVRWGLPVALGALAAVAATAGIGAGAERATMRPLRRTDPLTRAVATLAVVLVAQVVMRTVWGGREEFVPPLVRGTVSLGGTTVGAQTLLIIGVTLLAAAAIGWWFRRTLGGLALAAMADEPVAARLLGVDPGRVSLASWTLAGALGALAGTLVTPLLVLNPWQMTFIMVSSYAAALIGGFRSLPLTLAGGLLIGVVRAAITSSVSVSGLSETLGFIAVFAVLLASRGRRAHLVDVLRGEATALRLRASVAARRPRWTVPTQARAAAPWALGLAALAVPLLGDFWTFVATLAVVYALAGVSLVVLTGWSGQLNLHVAALGLGWGAYAAFALVALGLPALWALLGAAVLTLPFSLAVGAVAVRFRGLELAVATIALGLTFERLVFRNLGSWLAAGSELSTPFESSFVAMPRPALGGWSLDGDASFYLFCLALAAGVVLVVRNVGRGATHRALVAVREQEVAAEVAGLPAIALRIGAFAGSIAVAALAGALFASLKLGIAPEVFNLDLSLLLLAAVVIAGVRTLAGGIFGGALAAVLPEVVRPGAIPGDPLTFLGGERLFLAFAVGLVLTLVYRPQGLFGRPEPEAEAEPARRPVGAATRPKPPPAAVDPVLRTLRPAAVRAEALEVTFGGVRALDGASVWVPAGEVCALIGPNGAGKSTLFNALSGIVQPESGRVYLGGEDVTDMSPHRRTALGLGRTFQSVEVFGPLTVLENVMAAGHRLRSDGALAEALGLRSAARAEQGLRHRAMQTLDAVGLGPVADRRPDELPFGQLRRLELAVALVGDPAVLLLDEPSAGLDPDASAELAAVVSALRDERGLAVLLVEHDMAVVGGLADWVYVLDFGRVIAEGPPGDVRRDPLVIERYLGPDRERTGV